MWLRIWTQAKKTTKTAGSPDYKSSTLTTWPCCLLDWGSGFRNIHTIDLHFKLTKCNYTKHCPWVQLHPPLPPPPLPNPLSLFLFYFFFLSPPNVCTLLQQNCLLHRLALLCLSFYQFCHCFFTTLIFLSVSLFLSCFPPFKGNGKGRKELQLLASQLNKDKKTFLESLHKIKSEKDCIRKVQRERPPVGSCLVEYTESTVHKTSARKSLTSHFQKERTAVTSAEYSFTRYASINPTKDSNKEMRDGYSEVGTSRKHLCLQRFPNVEDKEDFRLFVEGLFRQKFEAK